MDDLRKDIPLEYNFLFTENHAEVISGKQEGVYAWIAINFMLGKFEHMVGGEISLVKVLIMIIFDASFIQSVPVTCFRIS